MGAGRTEIMRSLFGIDKGSKDITINDKKVSINSPEDARKNGIGLITENRKDEGLILDFSIEDNMVLDRKSTRLNSSHVSISYAVFCLKKDTLEHQPPRRAT